MSHQGESREIDMARIERAYAADPEVFLRAWLQSHVLAGRSTYLADAELVDREQTFANLAALNEVANLIAHQLRAIADGGETLPARDLFALAFEMSQYDAEKLGAAGEASRHVAWALEAAADGLKPLSEQSGDDATGH